jgi:hypothetical protein
MLSSSMFRPRPNRSSTATLFFGKSSSSFGFQFSTFKWVSLTPFPATLTSTLQITEKPASLSPAFATLTSRVKHKSCVCHYYKKHPGWGVPFSPYFRTIKRGEAAPIFLATRHSPLATSSVPLNLLKSTRIQPSAIIASEELTPKLNPLDATLTKNRGGGVPSDEQPILSPLTVSCQLSAVGCQLPRSLGSSGPASLRKIRTRFPVDEFLWYKAGGRSNASEMS